MKKKQKPQRRILILLAVGAALGILVGGTFIYRKHRLIAQTARWRADGIRADQTADYARAIESLELSLSREPDNREALMAYIDARPHVESPKLGHLTDTARATRYLLQLDPTLADFRQKLMSLYQQMGLRTETLDTAQALLTTNPKNASALRAKAETLTSLKRYDEAVVATNAWLDADPLNIPAQILNMSLMRQQGRSAAQIAAVVDAWHKAHPAEVARFDLLNGLAFAQAGDRENALSWLRKAAAEAPPDSSFSEILVSQIAALGAQDDELSILQHLVDSGAPATVQQTLLCRRWERGEWKQVAALASKFNLASDAVSPTVAALVAIAQRNLGNDAETANITAILSRRKDSSAAAWHEILNSPSADITAWRKIVEQCRAALLTQPGDGYLRYFLGEGLAATGETELALEAFQIVAATNPTWGLPSARMAELLLQTGDLRNAAQAAIISLHRNPNIAAALTIARVVASLDQKGLIDPQTLPKIADEIERVAPGNPDVQLVRIQSLARAGTTDKAVERIRALISASPPPSAAAFFQLESLSKANHLGVDTEILDASVKYYGATPELTLIAALQDATDGDSAAGLKRIDSAAHATPKTAARDWDFVRARYLDATASNLAPDQWSALSANYPNDPVIQRAALESPAMHTDRAFLEQVIGRLRAILGEQSLVCTLARVRMLVDNRATDADDRELADTLRQVILNHPTMAEPRILWAESLEKAGKFSDAIDQLETAQRVNPGAVQLSLKLASLYLASGNTLKARQQIDHVLASKAVGPDVALSSARILVQLGAYNDAAEILGHGITQHDQRIELLLAEIYWRQNQLAKVESMLPQLEADGSASAIEFVARFHAAMGRDAEANRALSKLDQLKIPAVEKSLARGNYYSSVGRLDDAITQFRQATTELPASAPARRSLIALLATTGNSAGAIAASNDASHQIPSDPAFAEIAQTISRSGPAFAVTELKPIVLEYIASPRQSQAARDILDTVAQARVAGDPLASMNIARSLVQHYPGIEGVTLWTAAEELRAGRTNDVATLLAGAMDTFASSPDVAAMTTRFYLARRQWTEALASAHEWRRRSASTQPADIAIARALIGINKPLEAVQQLEPIVIGVKKPADADADLLLTYANALQASGKTQQVEELLLTHVSESTRWRGICLQFATANLPDEDADNWIRKIAPVIDFNSIVETSLLARSWATLAARRPDNTVDRAEAARLFDLLAARSDVTAAIVAQAGVFAEQTGDLSKAITLYTRALRMDSHLPVVQNNLAMLMASTGGNLDDAARHAAAAIDADRAEPAFLDTLATIKSKAGDNKAAVDALRRAVDLDPSDPKWRVSLAEVYFEGGRRAEAAEALSSIDSASGGAANLSPETRKQVDALRARLAHSQNANGSATKSLTVAN